MLTLLLALTTPAVPTHLPLPSCPASIRETGAQPLPALQARVEKAATNGTDPGDQTNLEVWIEKGHNWSRGSLDQPQPPNRARELGVHPSLIWSSAPVTTWPSHYSIRDFQDPPTYFQGRYLPWHSIYQQRAGWPQQFVVADTLWYRTVTRPTASSAYFVVELDGLPHWKIRARTVEELEQKDVERYAALFDSPMHTVPRNPTVIYQWSGAPKDNRRATSAISSQDGIVAGVSFVF
jgi:hypothetical protein